LIALLNSNETQLDNVQHLILDEADRMLDMRFHDDIMRIVKQLPENRQTLLFSATMPPKIKNLAGAILNNPEEISLSISKPAAGISQKAFLTFDDHKTPLLKFILGSGIYETAIVFAGKKDKVKSLERDLKNIGMSVKAFSSDLDQSEREVIMRDFRAKKVQVLIGTDIISRGIDVENISLVVNYDVPGDPEDYVHRIGRTARASTKGEAITFINNMDMEKFNRIEALIEKSVMKTNSLPNQIGQGPEYQENARKSKPGGFKKKRP